MQEFLIAARPDLQAAREVWLKSLAGERRLSALTIEAYERDTRQFLHFLTAHLGKARPSGGARKLAEDVRARAAAVAGDSRGL
jgi:integrase/recombinase XerC